MDPQNEIRNRRAEGEEGESGERRGGRGENRDRKERGRGCVKTGRR